MIVKSDVSLRSLGLPERNERDEVIQLPRMGTREFLIEYGAEEIEKPTGLQDGLICVVMQDLFDTAYHVDTQEEFDDLASIEGRPVYWLIYAQAK